MEPSFTGNFTRYVSIDNRSRLIYTDMHGRSDFDWTKETASRDMSLREKNVRKTIHALFEKHANTSKLNRHKTDMYTKIYYLASINISKGEHHIVKFSIEKTAFQLGDTIRGLFDFSESNTTCQQVPRI